MDELTLRDRTVLVTGAGRRVGQALARACAEAGANLVIHFHTSEEQAVELQRQVVALGRAAWLVQADLSTNSGISKLIDSFSKAGLLYGLINSAAIFEPLSMQQTTYSDWDRHLSINLAAPFLLSQAFAAQVPADGEGRIVNVLDWRALRPGADHFPYSVSKAALAALTQASAAALAPRITVNGLALGAILPPGDRPADSEILRSVPAARWGGLSEVEAALIFLLTGPAYITGEIIHVDGGRHLL